MYENCYKKSNSVTQIVNKKKQCYETEAAREKVLLKEKWVRVKRETCDTWQVSVSTFHIFFWYVILFILQSFLSKTVKVNAVS